MELIREIESKRDKKDNLVKWGLYQCPNSVCNKEVERSFSNGKVAKSCGCLKGNIKHLGKNTKLYNVWISIKERCLNEKSQDYINYGGRGVTICNEWLEFIPFRDWSLSNGYKENLEIHRKNDGNYEPFNCIWVTHTENMRDTRGIKIKSIEEANEIRGLYATGNYTMRVLAKKYNITSSHISNIINYKSWR